MPLSEFIQEARRIVQLPKQPGQVNKGHDSFWSLQPKSLPKMH